jgi:hypothetical protein
LSGVELQKPPHGSRVGGFFFEGGQIDSVDLTVLSNESNLLSLCGQPRWLALVTTIREVSAWRLGQLLVLATAAQGSHNRAYASIKRLLPLWLD